MVAEDEPLVLEDWVLVPVDLLDWAGEGRGGRE